MIEKIWNAPETPSVNRLPMLNIHHNNAVSLDGEWDFQLLASPEATPTDDWKKIPVPGLWTMVDGKQPFGDAPIYTNVQMPWDYFPPFVPEDNPTGLYVRHFDLPSQFKGKRVVLQLGAAESVAIIYVNGKEVGVAKDSHLASDFDITPFLNTDSLTNKVGIKVIKWSDATYIEDQDQWWHGGISRSVFIYATEKVFIERLYANPTLKADNKTGSLHIRAHINSVENVDFTNYTLNVKVKGKKAVTAKAKVIAKSAPIWTERTAEEVKAGADFFMAKYWDGNMPAKSQAAWLATEPIIPGPLDFTVELPVNPWSAEAPHLYEVEYQLTDPKGKVVQSTVQKVGFRRVEVVGNEFLLNGQPIIFYGINRHDFHKRTGRVISRHHYREDLLELKRHNFNAIRTSHYPNDPALMDIADELGFYVIGEANIESHAFQNQLCDDQKYLNQWVDRIARMIQRDIHHASAVMWSLGNESGAGLNHRAAAAYARAFDPTRPLHYEGGIRGNWTANHDLTDVVCPMYPSISAIADYAKKANAGKAGKNARPLIMCEYTHAMGNSNGTLAEYWKEIHKTKGLQGGFIWEMWDHGLDQTMPDGTERSAYGGNYGEVKHDGNFVCDGMFFPDRTPKPAMQEFKYIAAPVFIERVGKTNKFKITNKNFFTDLSKYKLYFAATCNGDVEKIGEIKLPAVKARKSATFTVPANVLKPGKAAGERFINFSLKLATATEWSPVGTEVAWEQVALTSKALPKAKVKKSAGKKGQKVELVNKVGEIQIPNGVIAPQLTLWRAPTDNDAIGRISYEWDQWGLRDLKRASTKVSKSAGAIRINTTWKTSKGIAIKHVQVVQEVENGLRVTEKVTLPKELNDVARIGTNFEVNGSLSHYEYFGIGPNETMPDRTIGRVDKYSSTVEAQLSGYIKPQECGGHMGVRWFHLTSGHGKDAGTHGLHFQMDKPRMVTVTPVRSKDLADATHNIYVKRHGNTVVTIDAIQRGVGTASCGPDTLDQYKIKPGAYTWSWTVTAI